MVFIPNRKIQEQYQEGYIVPVSKSEPQLSDAVKDAEEEAKEIMRMRDLEVLAQENLDKKSLDVIDLKNKILEKKMQNLTDMQKSQMLKEHSKKIDNLNNCANALEYVKEKLQNWDGDKPLVFLIKEIKDGYTTYRLYGMNDFVFQHIQKQLKPLNLYVCWFDIFDFERSLLIISKSNFRKTLILRRLYKFIAIILPIIFIPMTISFHLNLYINIIFSVLWFLFFSLQSYYYEKVKPTLGK